MMRIPEWSTVQSRYEESWHTRQRRRRFHNEQRDELIDFANALLTQKLTIMKSNGLLRLSQVKSSQIKLS